MEKSNYKLIPYYDASDTYSHAPYTMVNLKNGYLMGMEMLPDGETTLAVYYKNIYEKVSFNPFKPRKYGEVYKIKLPRETVNFIMEAYKK